MSRFDGETFDPFLDGARLDSQLVQVARVMAGGGWWTLERIVAAVRDTFGAHVSEASVSARLRDFLKPRFGGHEVERRRVPGGNGLHEYRVVRVGLPLWTAARSA